MGCANRAETGLIDADLGGEVIKQRIAGPGHGKSKGYRAMVLFRRGARAFLMYGFSRSQRANFDVHELKQFKASAKHVLALSERQLAELTQRGDFVEIKQDGQKVSK